jgi:hypothetical protein
MKLFPGEPAYGSWRAEPIAAVLGTARLVAVDGRSAGGKTTTADRIAATVRTGRGSGPTWWSPGGRRSGTTRPGS